AVGPPHRDRPMVAAAHHHALEERLPSVEVIRDLRGHERRLIGRATRVARSVAGTARLGRRCRRASAFPCRTGGRQNTARGGSRASSNGSRTCCRTSTSPSRSRIRGGFPASSHPFQPIHIPTRLRVAEAEVLHQAL